MPYDTAYSENEQQQAPARASASEQPEALVQSKGKAKQFMNESLRSIQLQGLSPINARLQVAGDLPIDSFQCQLWEPARAVQELQPGAFLTSDACCSQLLLQRDGCLVPVASTCMLLFMLHVPMQNRINAHCSAWTAAAPSY